MTFKKLLNEKISELEEQAESIRVIQEKTPSLETQQEWLKLLTSYLFTLTEVHELDRENLSQSKLLV